MGRPRASFLFALFVFSVRCILRKFAQQFCRAARQRYNPIQNSIVALRHGVKERACTNGGIGGIPYKRRAALSCPPFYCAKIYLTSFISPVSL